MSTLPQLPVITDLRNPCMKAEHWKTLEAVVGTELNVEELTLSILDKINIFSYGTEIVEVTKITFADTCVYMYIYISMYTYLYLCVCVHVLIYLYFIFIKDKGVGVIIYLDFQVSGQASGEASVKNIIGKVCKMDNLHFRQKSYLVLVYACCTLVLYVCLM